MGLASRIIPVVLTKGAQLVKGKRFDGWRSCGNALQAARIHAGRSVDELVFIDIDATPKNHMIDPRIVERLTTDCFSPVTVGGGVRSLREINLLLRAGADKVLIGTAAIEQPEVLRLAADRFGSQAIVASLDVCNGQVRTGCNRRRWNYGFVWHAKRLEEKGAGEILLNSIDRDGTMEGYNIELIERVAKAVSIPVIACGGCSGYDDMHRALQAGASAVAAGALFLFTDATPAGAAQYLHEQGVEVRLPVNKEATCCPNR